MMNNIRMLIIDVDGTMTDGGVYYDENGNEMKKFCTRDAAGFFAAKKLGIKIMVLTGRKCVATERRMEELQVDYLYQNVKNKFEFLQSFIKCNNYIYNDIAYIGDDLNDYNCMKLVGYVGCPADSCQEVKKIADYVSVYNGGNGAVRDVIEHMLRELNQWDKAISEVYKFGI